MLSREDSIAKQYILLRSHETHVWRVSNGGEPHGEASLDSVRLEDMPCCSELCLRLLRVEHSDYSRGTYRNLVEVQGPYGIVVQQLETTTYADYSTRLSWGSSCFETTVNGASAQAHCLRPLLSNHY